MFWKARLERSCAILAQAAQIDRLLEAFILGNAGIGQAGPAFRNVGGGPRHRPYCGRARNLHSQGPEAVTGVGNGDAETLEVPDGVGLDSLAPRGQPVGGATASPSPIGRVGVRAGLPPPVPGWSA